MYLTDAQRDAFGAETKSIVRSTLSLITRLEPAEKICVQAAVRVFRKKNSSLLKSVWAGDDDGEGAKAAGRGGH